MENEEFVGFSKIYRLKRDIVCSEKLDGANAQVVVSDDGLTLKCASRNRWLEPGSDNFGFAAWCASNREELLRLGPGRHFGEWWGAGIQRRYDLKEKRFSLFNTDRWSNDETRPKCCHVVPVLYKGPFDSVEIENVMTRLKEGGSVAAPGFMKPEGLVVFHVPSQNLYKYTLDGDGHKGEK